MTDASNPAYNNQYLFPDHYLNHLLTADPRWHEAMAEAQTFLAWGRASKSLTTFSSPMRRPSASE
jgi:uncharacterized membrane protein YidH (DUF202 family)